MSRAGMPLRSATSGAISQTLSISWSSVGASVASGISSDVPIQQCVSASWNTETTKVGPAPCGASGTMVVNRFMQWLAVRPVEPVQRGDMAIFAQLRQRHRARLAAERAAAAAIRPALTRFYEALDQGQKVRFAGMS